MSAELEHLASLINSLAAQSNEIRNTVTRIETRQMESTQPRLHTLEETVFGTPKDPGLKTKMDRMEQIESRRTWALRAVIAAGITTTLGWLWQFISSFFEHSNK